ncbi:MAG TPA: low specificity L-threonine aldolase [Coriobacteriia bacterium]|jgi:threonine aldolase
MSETRRALASDNWAGVHPQVLAEIAEAGAGHVPAYGYDEWTERAVARFREHFGETAEVFWAFNGTGANVTALQACVKPFGAVICPATAHVNTDECGAPERFLGGGKLLAVETPDGKLTPELVEPRLAGLGNEHHNQPQAISITQSTELGTVYTPAEVGALAGQAHAHGMRLHVDGARIANAAAHLGVPVRAFTTDAGVDALSFGGTKNGAMLAEAVVLFDPELARDFRFIRKQSGQLASKSRFIAAQFLALFEDDLWLRSAEHSNAMAARLADGLRRLGIELTQQPQANEVFAVLPAEVIEPLQETCAFYVWDEGRSEVRLVTSWDTAEADVDGFLAALERLLRA